jgi:hypothetical protein
MRLVGRRDDDEIDVAVPDGSERIGHDRGVGIDPAHVLSLPRADDRQRQPGRGGDQRRVKHSAGVTKPDQRDARIGTRIHPIIPFRRVVYWVAIAT